MGFFSREPRMPSPQELLPGRDTAMTISGTHMVKGTSMTAPFPAGTEAVQFGMGCFWGAERKLWQVPGVVTTAVGYSAGSTPNPLYEEVCSGLTGHNETVLVIYEPTTLSFDTLLAVFWEGHNPTQGMRQGNDRGTQYRSGVYTTTDAQLDVAHASLQAYESKLLEAGHGHITTEVLRATTFYYAEEYHQQYLHKNPNGYCGLGGTGVSCPIGLGFSSSPGGE
jgi:peptide-methionine (S)-S-oxide reductase